MEELRNLIKEIKTLLKSSPDGSDIIATEEFLRKARSYHATLVTYYGKLEADRAVAMAKAVQEMDDVTFRKLKNSSTLFNTYVAGQTEEMTALYYTTKEMLKLLAQASDEYRTIISYRKTELQNITE